MKILILSDSHSLLQFMRQCARQLRPDLILHLGDYYDDGEVIRDEFPDAAFYQVPGNCDEYRCPPSVPGILWLEPKGVRIMMTHGHLHRVKQTLQFLKADARAGHADLVLYGHTHIPHCAQEEDGLWVMNPGTCGFGCCSAGVVEIENGKILRCYILQQEDLEVIT